MRRLAIALAFALALLVLLDGAKMPRAAIGPQAEAMLEMRFDPYRGALDDLTSLRLAPGLRASRRERSGKGSGRRSRGFALARIGTFNQPLHVAQPPGDNRRLFVVEKTGRVRVVRGGRTLKQPFLSLRGKVGKDVEQGLLSIAFAPDYQRSRRLYVSYTDRRGDSRVVEYRRSIRFPERVDRSTRRLVLKVPQPRPTHNVGLLMFGPDELLYIGAGDGGGPGDPARSGQDRSTLRGKILRIDPRRRGKRRYRSPLSNPFVGKKGARNEIYAYGLRNPWRFSFDRKTRALLIGDVGQEAWEEINYRPRRRAKGANFGWSAFEGRRRFNRTLRAPGHIPPMHAYGRAHGCSITGGYVVRDRSLPSLYGRYLYGDFCAGEIRSLVPHWRGGRDARRERVKVPGPSSFGEDNRGRVYVTSLGGAVYRLVPRWLRYPYLAPVISRSLGRSCRAFTSRTVPERDRMTSESVVAWPSLR